MVLLRAAHSLPTPPPPPRLGVNPTSRFKPHPCMQNRERSDSLFVALVILAQSLIPL